MLRTVLGRPLALCLDVGKQITDGIVSWWHDMKAEVATGEKRGEQRFPLGVSFTGQELSRTQKVSLADKTVAGVVHNISKTGIGVSTPASLAYSSVVRCDVAIKNLPVSIPTMAQVRWVKRVHAGEYRSGLAFLF